MRERNPCEVQRPEVDGSEAQRLFEESIEAGHVAKYYHAVEEVKQLERELLALEKKEAK